MLGVGFMPDHVIDATAVHVRNEACLAKHASRRDVVATEAIYTKNRFRGLQQMDGTGSFSEA